MLIRPLLLGQAFWTEPRDQSAWLYHRWLLGSCLAAADSTPSGATISDPTGGDGGSGGAASASPDAQAALQGRLAAEAAMCTELLQVGKYAILIYLFCQLCKAAGAKGAMDCNAESAEQCSPFTLLRPLYPNPS